MNPTSPTKPVMDVAAPKGPTPRPNPFTQATPEAARPAPSQPLPVRPAPLAASLSQPAAAPLLTARPPVKKPTPQSEGRTPVALITVTVFVMLVLSVLAVTVYMTSQTA